MDNASRSIIENQKDRCSLKLGKRERNPPNIGIVKLFYGVWSYWS